ncbi:MAG: putative rane protein [Ramlibacter sp.]|nr:putative rane protein [Ramlibacter sp.]
MDALAAGFWGAFFGTAVLMLALSLAAFARSHRRVALMAGLSALVSAAFVLAYLGFLPVEDATEARLLAHVAMIAATSLALMLLAMLGLLRQRGPAQRTIAALVGLGLLVVGAGWTLRPEEALALSSIVAVGVGMAMLVVTFRSALRGDRLAWTSVLGVAFMLVSLAGLSWIAFSGTTWWPVHAVSAVAGMSYLTVMASALWRRYSYLLELAEVMAHGPSYDPVTRMRSHSETGQMVGDLFFRREDGPSRSIGVIAICIANLYALENLHGRAAFNHALFVCAGRLRRCVPQYVEMGRLGEDGFLLLLSNPQGMDRVVQLARTVKARLSRPLALSTSRDPAGLEASATNWVAEVGIGVLNTSTKVRPSQAVATARAMARTAWSYDSRLAFYDQAQGRIAELPPEDQSTAPGPLPMPSGT